MTATAGDGSAGTGWRAVLLEMVVGLREAVARFPLATIFLLASTVQAQLLIADLHWFQPEGQGGSGEDVVIGLSSGALAALAVTLFGEARGHSMPVRSLAALVAGLAVSTLMVLPQTLLVLQWCLALAVAGLVLIAPFIGRGDSGSLWMFAARVAIAGFLGVLVLLFLAGGISAVLASLSLLFGLAVPDELHQHVWAFAALFAAPLFAVGQFPGRFDEQPDAVMAGFMDRGMRALGDFIVAPLLILYAVILHLYALRIVLTGEVPEGQIGWLVLVYGLCIFAALLLINPFFDRARAPTRLFLRLWPFFLPVPLVLLFYALALRVGEFGLTPDRYMLGLFGVVAAVILALQFVPRLRADLRLIAGLPVAALLVTSFGPQGAVGLSLSSQANRFLEIVGNAPVDAEGEKEALGALAFLDSRGAAARVAPEGLDLSEAEDGAYLAVAEAWGLDPRRPRPGLRGFMIGSGSEPATFSVDGFDTAIQNLLLTAEEPVVVDLPSGGELGFSLEADALVVERGATRIRFAISAADIDRLARRDDTGRLPVIALHAEGRRIALVPSYLYADVGEPPRLENLQGTILLRAADWR